MSIKAIISSIIIAAFSFSIASAAYTEVDCSTDAVFNENACNQCFLGGEQETGANIGLLSDQWVNSGEKPLLLFKGEQDEPRIISLNGAVWNQVPDADNFWEYTDNFEALYSEEDAGYILNPGESVDWIQSKLGYAYNLVENNAVKGENIGLLVYPIVTHVVNEGDDVDLESNIHNECVLFTSADTGTKIIPEKPKELPQTGPENFILLVLAMLLAFGVLKLTRKA